MWFIFTTNELGNRKISGPTVHQKIDQVFSTFNLLINEIFSPSHIKLAYDKPNKDFNLNQIVKYFRVGK